jgi:hypothetical protein
LKLDCIRRYEKRTLAICLALFSLNAVICWRLFGVEYLDAFQSNEGTFITFAGFLRRYWPHVGWFPWFDAGMPFEDTYLPLLPLLAAVGSAIARCSPAHAFHFVLALTYSLAPVFLFLFAQGISGRLAPSFWAALLWSLLSPAAVFPRLWTDMGGHWGMRRLQNIVFYGESPHSVALCLLPLSLWLTVRFLERRTASRFVAAVVAAVAVMLTNAFGIAVVAVSSLILLAARGKYRGKDLVPSPRSLSTKSSRWGGLLDRSRRPCRLFGLAGCQSRTRVSCADKGVHPTATDIANPGDRRLAWNDLLWVFGILAISYLAICPVLPPSLIRVMEANSQWSGGDFRFTFWTAILAGSFLAFLIGLWAVVHRYCSPIVQFAALFSACFGGVTWLGVHGINVLPQPLRYHIEMEAGMCLLAAFLFEPLARKLPRKTLIACGLVGTIGLAWAAVQDYRFARKLIRPADISHSLPFKEARWIAQNLPAQRVLVATEGQWLFNEFADNPQMSGGHEPSAPNWIQHVAVYTIFSGANAGDQDEPISLLWLKAFGCGAIVVPGADSKDYFHAVANPGKFDGHLPLVWREAGESIYRVPLRSTSLAHVIPRSAVVERRPINGLDVSPLQPYVAALDNPTAPEARLRWEYPDHGKILAKMAPSDVVSVQITADPGWQARVGSRVVPLQADQLGFIVIDPNCAGECTIDLEFTERVERRVTLAISLLVWVGLMVMAFEPVLHRLKPA